MAADDEPMDDDRVPRRAPRADLHVLPSGARDGGAGGADAAHARRAHDRGDRARVPRRPRRRWRSASCGRSARSRPPASRSGCRRDHLLPDRLAAVLAVVYLIFNEGYGGRGDLAAEALRLGRALAELMPDEPEVHGLLALMLLHDSRRAARFRDGELVLLADQDRALWDDAPDRGGAGGARPRAGAAAAAGRTCSRRRSRRCTPRSRATGRRSPRCTASCARLTGLAGRRAQPRRRASPRRTGPQAGLAIVDAARRSTTTATCTRPAASCCAGSARPRRRAAAYAPALELVARRRRAAPVRAAPRRDGVKAGPRAADVPS